ncbi:hypothetical protein Xcc1_22410 [Xanthomonas campestris pv. campestris]|nr:hypothetical protein Xcc1_22410 [Xanthomonas campestris pv. campestris]
MPKKEVKGLDTVFSRGRLPGKKQCLCQILGAVLVGPGRGAWASPLGSLGIASGGPRGMGRVVVGRARRGDGAAGFAAFLFKAGQSATRLICRAHCAQAGEAIQGSG